MRVRSNYYWQISAEDACSDLSYGSTEDYMVTIQGGLAPETLQFIWNDGAFTGNTFVANPSSSTEYTVSTTSANTGCTKTITIPVTVNALPNAPVIATSGASTLCAGSDVTLTLEGNEGVINPTVPLDEVNGATLAVGLRKLNSNYNGPALRLRRSSDNAEQDFGFTGNNLDVGEYNIEVHLIYLSFDIIKNVLVTIKPQLIIPSQNFIYSECKLTSIIYMPINGYFTLYDEDYNNFDFQNEFNKLDTGIYTIKIGRT
jgi:hypothetical protein